MNKAGKNYKKQYKMSSDPKRAELEQRMLDAATRVKKEKLNG